MDQELVIRAQQGDLQAFEALTTSTHPRLFRVALGILRDPDRAEDATQAAMIAIWRYLRRLREPAAFESWSYRLLVRACMRESNGRPTVLPEVGLAGHARPPISDDMATVVDRDRLERGFRRLSIEHRAVIVMRYLLDMPLEGIAGVLEVPVGTVASRLNRAMGALRAVLEADDRPAPRLLEARETDR